MLGAPDGPAPENHPDQRRDNIEVRFHKDGTVDEIVTWDEHGNCLLHIEQMDDWYFWGRYYGTTQDLIFHFGAPQGHKVWMNHEWDDTPTQSDCREEYRKPEIERKAEIALVLKKYGLPLLLETVADIYKRGRKAEFEEQLIKDLEGIKDKFVEGDKAYMNAILDEIMKRGRKNDET